MRKNSPRREIKRMTVELLLSPNIVGSNHKIIFRTSAIKYHQTLKLFGSCGETPISGRKGDGSKPRIFSQIIVCPRM